MHKILQKHEHVEGAKKLLKLTPWIWVTVTSKTVFSGIKSAYAARRPGIGKPNGDGCQPEAPRKMKFGMSEGMVLAAGPGGKDIWLLEPDEGAKPGMRIV